jgi:hypothetical protein
MAIVYSIGGCIVHRFATARNGGECHVILLIVLLPIAVLAFGVAVFSFLIHAWAKALVYACDMKFVSAGMWVCIGVFMINALNAALNGAEWHDMMPLYIAVMVVAVGGTIAKYAVRIRRQRTKNRTGAVFCDRQSHEPLKIDAD